MRDPHRESSGDKVAPKAVVGRVCLYLRQLETFQRLGESTISSSQLGNALSISDAQVRKDLAFFGQFGYPGIGYRIEELIPTLRHVLGTDHDWPMALVGIGNLGRALLRYRGFGSRGFHIVALFDADAEKVGREYDGLLVRPMTSLREVIASEGVSLAILSVPAEVAQAVADQLVGHGVTGILNFAPVALNVPTSVSVVDVDLSIQLEHLAYKVRTASGGISYQG